MQNTAKPDFEIIIIHVEENYWLANGTAHLDAVLVGTDPYPTPILCVEFRDVSHVESYIPAGIEGLWAVHPDIVGRLRRAGELIERVAD
ncbi:MAG: hypothetical protein D6754_07575 [Alphaproteobacteria bacterium]|nr:MAG: hypothetical protein D6754_07575 [Alphaproteobacteria bacterium]